MLWVTLGIFHLAFRGLSDHIGPPNCVHCWIEYNVHILNITQSRCDTRIFGVQHS